MRVDGDERKVELQVGKAFVCLRLSLGTPRIEPLPMFIRDQYIIDSSFEVTNSLFCCGTGDEAVVPGERGGGSSLTTWQWLHDSMRPFYKGSFQPSCFFLGIELSAGLLLEPLSFVYAL